jgi:putative exopolysaccharide biosynthesis protein
MSSTSDIPKPLIEREEYSNNKRLLSNKAIKNNYIWNMIGSFSASFVSVVLLLLASRLLTSDASDMFSIAFALGQQFYVLGYFQIRNLQSTDVKDRYSFASYHNTRLFTVFLMLATAVAYIIWQGYDFYKASIIFLLVFYRAIDAYSDVFQGLFQQRNRSDLAGKIQFYRSCFCMLLFGGTIFVTKSLLLASFVIGIVNLMLTIPLDIKYYRNYFCHESLSPRLLKDRRNVSAILKSSFPLFFNGFLLAYIYNEPKISIDLLLSVGRLPAGMQRDFNILFMPVFVLSLLFLVLRPLTTQLSIYWNEYKYEKFFKQTNQLFLCMIILGILIVGVGYSIGTEILGVVYGVNLQIYKVPFSILLIAGILNVLVLIIDIIMTIFGKQLYLMVAYLLTFAVSKFITLPFIRSQKLMGAANSFLLSMFVFFATSLIIYVVAKNQEKRKM